MLGRKPSSDPSVFRRGLKIDADGKAVSFTPDAWQEADFRPMDAAWKFAAGLSTSAPPIQRAWQERPRGHAKTADLAVMAAWALAFATRPIRGIAAASDQQQAGLLRDAIQTLCRLNTVIGGALDVQRDVIKNKRTGAQLDILSSDVASSYGQLPDFVCLDEIAHWPDRGQELWISLLSAAAKRANCLLIVITNAGFAEHWTWKVRESIRTDPTWRFSHLNGPQASWIKPARLAEQHLHLPGSSFQRLWMNEWIAGTGDALQSQDIDAAIRAAGPMHGSEDGWRFFGGLDLSVSRDTSAHVVVGKHMTTGLLKLAKVMAWVPPRGGKIDLTGVRLWVALMHRQFHCRTWFDPFQAELLSQDCQRQGIPMEATPFVGTSLSEMASALTEAFASRAIELFPDAELVADLRRLRIKESPSGWRLDAPRTSAGHCDRATGLALALLGARRAGISGLWAPPVAGEPNALATPPQGVFGSYDHVPGQRQKEGYLVYEHQPSSRQQSIAPGFNIPSVW